MTISFLYDGIAIDVHHGSYKYEKYQDFLRFTSAAIEKLKLLNKDLLKREVADLLLTIVIASHGLSKNFNLTGRFHTKDIQVYRAEKYRKNSKYIKEYAEAITKKKLLSNKGFTSTSLLKKVFENKLPGLYFKDHNVFFTLCRSYGFNSLGKNISSISQFPDQAEVVYPPNTQFIYTQYENFEGKLYILGEAVRTIEGIEPHLYSTSKRTEAGLGVCYDEFNKIYEEIYLNSNDKNLILFCKFRNNLWNLLVDCTCKNKDHLIKLNDLTNEFNVLKRILNFQHSQHSTNLNLIDIRLNDLIHLNNKKNEKNAENCKITNQTSDVFFTKAYALGGTSADKITYRISSIKDFIHAVQYIPEIFKLKLWNQYQTKLLKMSVTSEFFITIMEWLDLQSRNNFFSKVKFQLLKAISTAKSFKKIMMSMDAKMQQEFFHVCQANDFFSNIESGYDLGILLSCLDTRLQKKLMKDIHIKKNLSFILEDAVDLNHVIKSLHKNLLNWFMTKKGTLILGVINNSFQFEEAIKDIGLKKFKKIISLLKLNSTKILANYNNFLAIALILTTKQMHKFIDTFHDTLTSQSFIQTIRFDGCFLGYPFIDVEGIIPNKLTLEKGLYIVHLYKNIFLVESIKDFFEILENLNKEGREILLHEYVTEKNRSTWPQSVAEFEKLVNFFDEEAQIFLICNFADSNLFDDFIKKPRDFADVIKHLSEKVSNFFINRIKDKFKSFIHTPQGALICFEKLQTNYQKDIFFESIDNIKFSHPLSNEGVQCFKKFIKLMYEYRPDFFQFKYHRSRANLVANSSFFSLMQLSGSQDVGTLGLFNLATSPRAESLG